MAKTSREGQHLRRTLEQLFASQPNDMRLRDHLEGLRRDPAIGELTPFWGPVLYRRNRTVFRVFIFGSFSTRVREGKFGVRSLKWADDAPALDGWLGEARAARDTAIVRRLLAWKYAAAKGWGIDATGWHAALLKDFLDAGSPAARQQVLEEYDNPLALDESTALPFTKRTRKHATIS